MTNTTDVAYMNESQMNAEMLITNMLEVSRVVASDRHAPDFNIYRIEVGAIGFSISAKRNADFDWVIRTWSTYNV